jgi:hypothetical protein
LRASKNRFTASATGAQLGADGTIVTDIQGSSVEQALAVALPLWLCVVLSTRQAQSGFWRLR